MKTKVSHPGFIVWYITESWLIICLKKDKKEIKFSYVVDIMLNIVIFLFIKFSQHLFQVGMITLIVQLGRLNLIELTSLKVTRSQNSNSNFKSSLLSIES